MAAVSGSAVSTGAAGGSSVAPAEGGRRSFWTPLRIALLLAIVVLPLGFAAFTQHVWEDFYITYRVSKNLVSGHGLVFQPGERVHTFTSPLGVLVPALCGAVAGTANDGAALWLFRAVNVGCLLGVAALLFRIVRRLELPRLAQLFLAGLLLFDAKITDFSMNGMETAILLLCFAWLLDVVTDPAAPAWRLGVGLGAIMWARPDGFVFAGVVLAGAVLFRWGAETPPGRRALVAWLGRAALIGGAIYLPWFAWAWSYYGSPIPNTIIAKSVVTAQLRSFGPDLWLYPLQLLTGKAQLTQIFLPTYHALGGWPEALRAFSLLLTVPAAFYFIVPQANRTARALSLALFVGGIYLQIAPPSPWYLQVWTLLAAVTNALILADGWRLLAWLEAALHVRVRMQRLALHAGLMALVLTQAGLWISTARQMRIQQAEIETGVRRAIGQWLKQNAKPTDRVMLEPLGYIGYFSGLKMLDFPGLSAPEVTRVLKKGANGWGGLLTALQPEWAVLRPGDLNQINQTHPDLLKTTYALVGHSDVRKNLEKYSFLPGRGYVEFDAVFVVLRRNPPSDAGRLNAMPAAGPVAR